MLPALVAFGLAVYEPLQLTDENFEAQLNKSRVSFVMASRSNITFCQSVLPKFRAVAEIMKDKCQFVVLEHDASAQVREKYGIFSYPSLFVFRGTTLSAEYPGQREAPPMLAYLKRIIGPRVVRLDSARTTNDFLNQNAGVVVLAGYDISKQQKLIFQKVANNLSDLIPFAFSDSPEAIQQLGLEEGQYLRLHRRDDRKTIEFDIEGNYTEENLRTWVLENRTPRYWAKNGIIFRDLAFDSRLTLVSLVDTTRKASMDAMHLAMERVFTEYNHNITYVYADIQEMSSVAMSPGVTGQADPLWLMVRFAGGEMQDRYAFPEGALGSPENIARFVAHVLNITAQAAIKSEEPVPNQSGPLYKLVGKEFRDSVADPKLDVATAILIGSEENRTKTLTVVNETAQELTRQKTKTVKFYYIDMELNDLPGLEVGNWTSPVVLLWPAGADKVPFLFQGDIPMTELMSGIKTHGKTKLRFKIPEQKDTLPDDL
jgi:thiol-disulfide isomerase/thioredoxin